MYLVVCVILGKHGLQGKVDLGKGMDEGETHFTTDNVREITGGETG